MVSMPKVVEVRYGKVVVRKVLSQDLAEETAKEVDAWRSSTGLDSEKCMPSKSEMEAVTHR